MANERMRRKTSLFMVDSGIRSMFYVLNPRALEGFFLGKKQIHPTQHAKYRMDLLVFGNRMDYSVTPFLKMEIS